MFNQIGQMVRQIDQAQYWLALLIGTILHEAGHVLVAFSQGVRIAKIRFDWRRGPYIKRDSGTPIQSLRIGLAGPAANLVTFVATLHFRTFAYTNLAIFLINILPFVPASDGKRALQSWRSL